MQRYFKYTVVTLSLASIGIMSACAANDNVAGQPPPTTTVCPDTLVQVDEAILSAAIDEKGNPIGITSVFGVDTPKIYGTFMVPDICCTTIYVNWFYGEEVVGNWLGVGIGNLIPQTLVLDRPAGGFAKGDYRVTMYLGIRELVTRNFSVK